jgi:pSer/pThr/pTyr-binding forkhead associated (FHA) protein
LKDLRSLQPLLGSPETPPAVFIEALSGSADVVLSQGSAPSWGTQLYDMKEPAGAADQPLDRLHALLGLVDDASPVFALMKSDRNNSPNVCVGRAKRNDVVIEDKTISSLHCSLSLGARGAIITDHSSNGTFVNRVRLAEKEQRALHGGDHVRLGKRSFYFLTGEQVIAFLSLREPSR